MISLATEWWLELEYARSLPENDGMRESILFSANEAEMSDVEQPEALLILNMLRFSETTYWYGGLADQPYLLMKELNAAATGEKRHQDLQTSRRLMEMNS